MQTVLTLVLLAAIATPASAHEHDASVRSNARTENTARVQRPRSPERRAQQTEQITRTVRIGGSGELDVSNVSGDILITRGSGNDAAIDITKTARGGSDQDARELLQLVRVDITERNNRVEIRTRYPQGNEMPRGHQRNVNVNVDISVAVPPGTRVRAHSISGSVSAADIKGELSLESVSGNLRITNGGRMASAKSISGSVEVTEADTEVPFQVSSVSGNVILRRVKAQQLTVGAISGDIVLDDVSCPRIKAQTVSGTVRFSGVLSKAARFDLSSHSGNIEVGIDGGTGFELEATSFSGSIRSDFPLKSQGTDAGRRRQQWVRGTFGDASAVLNVTTFSGSIVVSKSKR